MINRQLQNPNIYVIVREIDNKVCNNTPKIEKHKTKEVKINKTNTFLIRNC